MEDSLQRISDLLQGGTMIDFNMMTDHLNNILGEMCQLIEDQQRQISDLKQEQNKYAMKEQVNELTESSGKSFAEIHEKIDAKTKEIQEQIQGIENRITDTNTQLSTQIELGFTESKKENEANSKLIKDDLIVINQQLKNLHKKNLKYDDSFKNIATDLDGIHAVLSKDKDKYIELIAQRVATLEQSTEQMVEKEKQDINAINELHNSLKKQTDLLAEDAKNEIHYIGVQIDELKASFNSTTDLTFGEGDINPDALIRAIQRDTRRIDSFNEMITAVKDEHNDLRDLFTNVSDGFHQIQVQILNFAEDHNRTTKKINTRINEGVEKSNEIVKEIVKFEKNLQDFVDIDSNTIQHISDTFTQLFSFISKASNRPAPLIKSMDDIILDYQKLTDGISYTAAENQLSSADKTHEPDEPFHLNYVQLNTLPAAKEVLIKKPIGSMLSSISKTSVNPSLSSSIEVIPVAPQNQELNHLVVQLQNDVKDVVDTIVSLKSVVLTKLDSKADTEIVERMLEAMRKSVSTVRNTMTTTLNQNTKFITKDDVELMLDARLGSSSGRPLQKKSAFLMLPSSKATCSAVQSTIIQPITKANVSHQAIYGSFAGINPIANAANLLPKKNK